MFSNYKPWQYAKRNKTPLPESKPVVDYRSLWDLENFSGNGTIKRPINEYTELLKNSGQDINLNDEGYNVLKGTDLNKISSPEFKLAKGIASEETEIKEYPNYENFLLPTLMGINAISEYDTKLKESDKFLKKSQDIFRGNPVYTNTMYGNNENMVYAEHGAKIKNTGAPSIVEAEGGETLHNPLDPVLNGVFDINGQSHEEGGVNIAKDFTKPGTVIFSNTLKNPLTGKTFAKDSKKYQTEYDYEKLESLRATPEEITTAKLNIAFKEAKLKELEMIQQSLNGNNTGTFASKGAVIVQPPYDIKEAYKEMGIKRFNELRKELNLPEVKTINEKTIAEMQSTAVKTNPDLIAAYVKNYANPSNTTKKVAGLSDKMTPEQKREALSKMTPEQAQKAYQDNQWWYRGVRTESRPAESKEAYEKWLEEVKTSGVKQGDTYYNYDTQKDDGTFFTYTPPTETSNTDTVKNPITIEKEKLQGNEVIDRGLTKSESTPYEMEKFGISEAYPFLNNYISAIRPFSYQPADYNHWEMNPQEVNVRPQIEQLSQMLNRSMSQTTGNPSLQSSRNQMLFAQGVQGINEIMGNAENKNAELRQNADTFNINARNTEQQLDIQSWQPIYNEFMAAAQDAAMTERSRAISKLYEAKRAHTQNEKMIKLYDDTLLPSVTLNKNEVKKDEKAKANITIPFEYIDYNSI